MGPPFSAGRMLFRRNSSMTVFGDGRSGFYPLKILLRDTVQKVSARMLPKPSIKRHPGSGEDENYQ
jgi:hypothetical protein